MGGKRWYVGSEIYRETSAVDENAILFYLDTYIIRIWHWPVLWIGHVYDKVNFFSWQIEGLVGCDFNINGSWAIAVLIEIPIEGGCANHYDECNCGCENNIEAFGPSRQFCPPLTWL